PCLVGVTEVTSAVGVPVLPAAFTLRSETVHRMPCASQTKASRPEKAASALRARVALARVLAQRAGLLLLDEPTAALDLRHQELVLRVCRERAAAGAAVAVVLHDLGLAAAHADRVGVLHDGRIAVEAPSEVFGAELLSRVYRQPVEVLPHPRTGVPLLVPVRHADAVGTPSPKAL
ncbi:hypothetical protein ACFUTZ_13610, partial [Streptomyces cinereoruber]